MVNFLVENGLLVWNPFGKSSSGPCPCLRLKKTGGCLCRAISRQPYDQNQQFFFKNISLVWRTYAFVISLFSEFSFKLFKNKNGSWLSQHPVAVIFSSVYKIALSLGFRRSHSPKKFWSTKVHSKMVRLHTTSLWQRSPSIQISPRFTSKPSVHWVNHLSLPSPL